MTAALMSSDPGFSLTETFDRFAAKAVKDFPELKGKFVFYSAPTDTLHGDYDDSDINALTKDDMQEVVKMKRDSGSDAVAMASPTPDGGYLLAYMRETPDSRLLTTNDDPYEREIVSVLTHELGHLVAPGGNRKTLDDTSHIGTFFECVADAFSFIRQIQDNYKVHEQMAVTRLLRSTYLITEASTSHFTSPVLHELGRMSGTYNLADAVPTALHAQNLAYRLALIYSTPQEKLEKLTKIFAPTKQVYEEKDTIAALEECAKIMFADHGDISHTVFIAGKDFLMPFLDHSSGILATQAPAEDLPEMQLTGDFWDDIREKIKDRTLQEETKTLQQRLTTEALDAMVLGFFDKGPDSKIDPAVYESKKNQDYLQRAKDVYISVRHFQETGTLTPVTGLTATPDMKTMTPDQIITLAKKIATDPPPPIVVPKKRWISRLNPFSS